MKDIKTVRREFNELTAAIPKEPYIDPWMILPFPVISDMISKDYDFQKLTWDQVLPEDEE